MWALLSEPVKNHRQILVILKDWLLFRVIGYLKAEDRCKDEFLISIIQFRLQSPNDVLLRKARGILNKLCPQKFDILVEKFNTELQIDSEEKLRLCMELVFEKVKDVTKPNHEWNKWWKFMLILTVMTFLHFLVSELLYNLSLYSYQVPILMNWIFLSGCWRTRIFCGVREDVWRLAEETGQF